MGHLLHVVITVLTLRCMLLDNAQLMNIHSPALTVVAWEIWVLV